MPPLPITGVALVLALPLLVLAGSAHAAPAPSAGPFTVAVAATPATGSVPLTVTLTATVSAGTPTSVAWNFGDGGLWSGSGAGALSVTHRYTSVGSFVASAQVSETTGVVSGSTTVAVANGPVVAAISATPSAGSAPLGVVLRAVVSGGTGTYTAFDWNFGDGSSASGPVVSHTFHSAGSYAVTLAVTDSANSSTAVSFTLSVTSAPASSTWNPLGLATIASVGVAGAGLTYGVLYAGRRRRAHRRTDDVVEEYAQVPPGAAGPFGDAIAVPLVAAPESEASSAAAVGESLPIATTAPRVSAVSPTPRLLTQEVGSASVARPAPAEPRRWSRDLVAYLGSLPTLGPDDIPSVAWTQKGMSDRLGTGQNQVSNVLRRLVSAGLVVEELQHVQGQPRRLKVYRLSLRGEALAREMRRNRPGAPRDFLKREW